MPKAQTTTINDDFKGKDILSVDQFDATSIFHLFKTADHLRKVTHNSTPNDTLKGRLATLLFYEPSSRTFSSFSAAIKRLGGQTIDHQNPMQNSSAAKGETLEDTIRTFESYSDIIVMRHPVKGSAQIAADAADIPIINAGDGVGEHPSQALLDLYTIYEKFGRLDHLTVMFAGDLLNGRTVHSLIRGLSLFEGNTIYLLSPEVLKLSREDFENFEKRGLKLIEIHSEKEIPKDADVWYWTRVQKERFDNIEEYERVKHSFIVTPDLMNSYAKQEMILMHPLPRVGEIDVEVDSDPRSFYLSKQMRNGMYIRMALISLVLGKIS